MSFKLCVYAFNAHGGELLWYVYCNQGYTVDDFKAWLNYGFDLHD